MKKLFLTIITSAALTCAAQAGLNGLQVQMAEGCGRSALGVVEHFGGIKSKYPRDMFKQQAGIFGAHDERRYRAVH